MGQKGFGAIDDAPEVDVHDPLDVLEGGLLDVAVVVDAGIVVDLVDRAEVGDDGVGVSQNRLAFGDVESIGLHLRAECFGPAHRFGQSLGVDVGERESCASPGEVERQRSADPGARSGDDGDFAFELLCVHLFLALRARCLRRTL